MAAGRLIWPLIEPVLNATGAVVSGAVLTVYQNRTVTLANIFADMAMVTPIANPQSGVNASNASGRFFVQTKVIWAVQGALYTLRIDRPDGTFDTINDIQPQGNEVEADVSQGLTTIYGLSTSNSATGLTTHVAVAVGRTRNSTDVVTLSLAAPMTKRVDQAWSAGNNGGGRDTGALGASQTWFIFIIAKTDGTTDVIFSASPTAPTLPTGYLYFRRLGAFLTDSGSLIREYTQTGNWFKLKVRSTDFAAQANGVGPYLRQVTVPNGIKVEAEFYFQSVGTASTTAFLSILADPDFGVPPAFGGATQWAQIRRIGVKDTTGANICIATVVCRQFTDASRQVYTYSSDASDVIALGVLGWRDDRGGA